MLKYLTLLLLFFIHFSVAQDQILIFGDSPDGNVYYDASWGFADAPSQLTLAGSTANKFPLETNHVFKGVHSLLLQWTSSLGGDWGVAVAAVGWTAYDYTQYDSITYKINGPIAVTQDNLPDLLIEDLSNNKSGRVWLGSYLAGVDADPATWQTISIPISDIHPAGADFTKIKTIFHVQKNTDGNEHILWLDDVRVIKAGSSGISIQVPPANVSATAHDSRVDLRWDKNINSEIKGFHIFRALSKSGVYQQVNPGVYDLNIYSDFIGQNGVEYFYYVTGIDQNNLETNSSDTVQAMPYAMTDDELLTSVQEATFRYFYDFAHPVSGMARERNHSGNTCTTGGTGFGLMTLIAGTERGFESRTDVAAHILKLLKFMQNNTIRYHGAWAHWINGETGATIPFSQYDDGGDLVETAFFIQGVLTVRQYFDQDVPNENEIRALCTTLWEEVDWNWYRKTPAENVLYWHWSPNYGWKMNLPIRGYMEAMIVYLLAIASPTHAVPATLYENGWAQNSSYVNGKTFYGYKQWVGKDLGGPLFFTHYSFLGFDPRDKADKYCNYFDNNRNISMINRAYCADNPHNYTGYNDLVWGLTASDDPFGYSAHEPANDNGTITPTAAISAMPYIPAESIATLKYFYHKYGDRLWGAFGFYDAFNLKQNWFADTYLAIDQGTIVPMIENYRSGLLWNLFMSNPEIQPMLDAIGFSPTGLVDEEEQTVRGYHLYQNYPNPFNPQTTIHFDLKQASDVEITLYDPLGRKVALILDKTLALGTYFIPFKPTGLASGVYYYRLQARDISSGLPVFYDTSKMIIIH